jgi:hypothetical protein
VIDPCDLDQMPFGRDFCLLVEGKPLADFPTKLFVDEINVETGALTEVTYTTTVQLDREDLVSDEMNESMAKFWAEIFERRMLNAMFGRPSEYEQSLRAAGAKV